MKKQLLVLSVAAAATLSASGYRIPETSLDGVALSAACVANAQGADAAYYNPAAMVYNEDADLVEAGMTYINLPQVRFSSAGVPVGESEKEQFIVPNLHYTSSKLAYDMRFGLSIVVPAGLSKRWKTAPGSQSANEFTLETTELNPTLALPLGDRFSIAAGVRLVHSSGVVRAVPAPGFVMQDMTGDSYDFGYNLALNYKATDAMNIAMTYRSKVGLTVDGQAYLMAFPFINGQYPAKVEVPIPASLNLAVAHKVGNATIEFDYERVFWSEYTNLDFNFDGFPEAVFGAPRPKQWNDSDTFRLGMTYHANDQWKVMGAVAYDETPVPNATIGFELPDADAWIVSLGTRYQMDEKMSIGVAALASMKEDRTVINSTMQGEFTNSGAYLLSVGMEYKF